MHRLIDNVLPVILGEVAEQNIGIDLDSRALAAFECDFAVERIHGCAHRFLSEFDYRGSELVYCDPPYLQRTRTSG